MFLWGCIISLTVWSHVLSWVGALCPGRFTAAVATTRCQFQGCGCMMPLPVWFLVLSWGSLFRGLCMWVSVQGGLLLQWPPLDVSTRDMGVSCHFLWPHVLSGGWSLSRGGSALLPRIAHGTDHTYPGWTMEQTTHPRTDHTPPLGMDHTPPRMDPPVNRMTGTCF